MTSLPQIKVVLLGESGVGKTCIVQRFAHDKFNEESTATLGAMFISKVLDLPELGVTIKYQIWDTAGQEKYRSLAAMYYQDAAAAILVYDITKKESFDGITYWMSELKTKAPEGIKVAIAANKSDLVEQEAVHFNDAKKFADDNSAILKMTSAKDGTGIRDIFLAIASALGQINPQKPAAAAAGIKVLFVKNSDRCDRRRRQTAERGKEGSRTTGPRDRNSQILARALPGRSPAVSCETLKYSEYCAFICALLCTLSDYSRIYIGRDFSRK